MFKPFLRILFKGEPPGPGQVPDTPAPSAGEALLARAKTAYAGRDYESASILVEQALTDRHDLAEAHLLLGLLHRRRQRWEDAADCFNLAACFDPALLEADYQLALIAMQRGAVAEAVAALEKVVAAQPDHARARVNLGKLLLERRDYERAEAMFREAIVAEPGNVHALNNLGLALLEGRDRPDEALHCIEEALAADPSFASAHCNRSMVLQYLGRCEAAVEAADRALELEPGMAQARLNRALALLMQGHFAQGWQEYEVRKLLHPTLQRPFPAPEWLGQPLEGKTLLINAEQGLGDEIMFASCLSQIIQQADHVVVECHRKLEKLFTRSFPTAAVAGADQGSTDLSWLRRFPAPDYRIQIGSLPLYFRNALEDFPQHGGYLRAEPARIDYWRKRLRSLGPGRKVGLSWRGGSSKQIHRSMAASELLPLLRVPDSHFISLQYTECADELRTLLTDHGALVHHWQEAIDDYDETAALVCALDGVVSVQTAVVHLAGALGRPVWVMVPAVPEWRYQCSGERLPWYPSLRIFRQAGLGEWKDVIRNIATELNCLGVHS